MLLRNRVWLAAAVYLSYDRAGVCKPVAANVQINDEVPLDLWQLPYIYRKPGGEGPNKDVNGSWESTK